MTDNEFRLDYAGCKAHLTRRLAEPAPGRVQVLTGPRQVGKTTLLFSGQRGCRTHAWKRRWQVDPDPYSRGNAFHWQPVRSTYKMPSMTWRKGTTGRPLVPRGFSGGRSGWSWAQRSSGMRQIVRNRRFDRCCCDEGVIDSHAKYTRSPEKEGKPARLRICQ